jgi:hypothetical protein
MNINLTAPTKWSELTADQFRMVVKTMLLHLTESERLFVLFCQLTGIRRYADEDNKFVTADGQDFRMEDWQVADFCDRLRWLIDTVPDDLPNPTKKDDYLRDISFGDWFEADTQFRLYEDDHDLAHFDIILPKLDEEPHEIDEAEAVVLKMWWNCVMGQIGPMYPNVFAKSEGNGGAFNPFKSLQEMHLLLNDDHPQENEKIDNSRLHDVLSALDSVIAKLKAREAEYNKIRRP